MNNYPPGVTGNEPQIAGAMSLTGLSDYIDEHTSEGHSLDLADECRAILEGAFTSAINMIDEEGLLGTKQATQLSTYIDRAATAVQEEVYDQAQILADEIRSLVPEEHDDYDEHGDRI